jgi:hypothetical protein
MRKNSFFSLTGGQQLTNKLSFGFRGGGSSLSSASAKGLGLQKVRDGRMMGA